jgi:hypothetical protein
MSLPSGLIFFLDLFQRSTSRLIQLRSQLKPRSLKAKWTPELGQDLNAYHNLDAEVELTSILSEQIALEIDREILADLVNGATAATFYWSRSPGLFVNRSTGAEIGATSAAPDFTGTVSNGMRLSLKLSMTFLLKFTVRHFVVELTIV